MAELRNAMKKSLYVLQPKKIEVLLLGFQFPRLSESGQ